MVEDVIAWLLVVFGLWWFVLRRLRSHAEDCHIVFGDKSYSYRIGDFLSNGANASNFHGIVLQLPAALPHIYIDGHAKERMRGPRYTYPPRFKLSLEGSFDQSFQVYALPQYHSLVLSILTPDVMAVLVDILPRYDIEIVGSELSIISRDTISRRPKHQEAIVESMRHLAPEILHRLKSWRVSDAQTAGNLVMKGQPYDVVKVGRKGISSMHVIGALLFAIPGLGVMGIAATLWSQPYPINHQVMPWVMAFGFVIFPCAWLVYILVDRNTLKR